MNTKTRLGTPASRRQPGTRDQPLVAIVVDAAVWFDREIVAGAAQYAREIGDWRLYVEEETVDRLPDLRSWRGRGIIASFDDERIATAVTRCGLPAVAVGGMGHHDPASGIPYVGTDNVQIGQLAAEHLLERGLPHFGYYGTVPSATTRWSEIRGQAFGAGIAAAGRPCSTLIASHASRRWDKVQQELGTWLESLPKPVGIMACDDIRARHVLESCRSLGLRVPHEVALIGVDDDAMVCELTTPPLTSIAQSARRIGYEAARLLDRLMRPERFTTAGGAAEPAPPRTAIPAVGIVPRASTDTLAVDDPVISKVIVAVRDEACRDLTIDGLVRMTGVPRWKLEKQFKQVVGHSIHDDMVRVRLAEARRLICRTNLPLKVVAARSGFNTLAYMTTIFRRRFGMTPARMRQFEHRDVVAPDRAPDHATGE